MYYLCAGFTVNHAICYMHGFRSCPQVWSTHRSGRVWLGLVAGYYGCSPIPVNIFCKRVIQHLLLSILTTCRATRVWSGRVGSSDRTFCALTARRVESDFLRVASDLVRKMDPIMRRSVAAVGFSSRNANET